MATKKVPGWIHQPTRLKSIDGGEDLTIDSYHPDSNMQKTLEADFERIFGKEMWAKLKATRRP